MIVMEAYLRASFRFILLGWVALNLVMASVPRCDLILSAVHKSFTSADAGMHDHCAPKIDSKKPALNDHRLCGCILAKMVFGRLPEVRHEPIVTRQPHALAILEFSYFFTVSQHISSIETPPPRIV